MWKKKKKKKKEKQTYFVGTFVANLMNLFFFFTGARRDEVIDLSVVMVSLPCLVFLKRLLNTIHNKVLTTEW